LRAGGEVGHYGRDTQFGLNFHGVLNDPYFRAKVFCTCVAIPRLKLVCSSPGTVWSGDDHLKQSSSPLASVSDGMDQLMVWQSTRSGEDDLDFSE
jgi:hypothetical protein